ncbi:hypothetical protein AWC38_SpisGene21129 [Stylophora pistillata]|uniref:Uncharacterized protein n=1 Tax=Stylophora pistillata TaxID=50429 RepID=A0A2B4REI3_STYPI|nr:hypothetical protein AWC38_SpisGene21129 [Stylophora pistillata]
MYNSSQGFSSQVGYRGQCSSASDSPIFRRCVEQSVIPSSSQQRVFHDSDLLRRDPLVTSVTTAKNPIFQHCLDNMKAESRSPRENSVFCNESNESNEQYSRELARDDGNITRPYVVNERFSSQDTSKTSSSSLTNASKGLGNEMQTRLKLVSNETPEVAVMYNIRGQPTSPNSTGVSSPHLAGVGRARLHAEARRKNFGGVTFSPSKTSDALARTSKTSMTSGRWASFALNGLPRTALANLSAVVKVVTFVPYHVLVILELDGCSVYLVVCVLRVARLLLSGRLYVSFAWTLSNVAEYKAALVPCRSKSLTARKTCGKTRKEYAEEYFVERTVDASPFLRHIKKLIATEMDRDF